MFLPCGWNNTSFVTWRHITVKWPKLRCFCNKKETFLSCCHDTILFTRRWGHFSYLLKNRSLFFNFLAAVWPCDNNNVTSTPAWKHYGRVTKDSVTSQVNRKHICNVSKVTCLCNFATWQRARKISAAVSTVATSMSYANENTIFLHVIMIHGTRYDVWN